MEIFCFHGKRTGPASLVSGSHALPPAFGACTTARFLRFEPPNSTNLHPKLVWSWHPMASPPPPQDALHSVQPLQFPQTQSRTCKPHSAKNQWICASVQKCPKYPNLQTSKNVSTDLPSQILSIHSHPKDSAPPPLWPRMPWARKYFRCMPLQRGKQEKIRDICADSRYSYDLVTKGNEIPSSHWLGMKRQGSTLHIHAHTIKWLFWNIKYNVLLACWEGCLMFKHLQIKHFCCLVGLVVFFLFSNCPFCASPSPVAAMKLRVRFACPVPCWWEPELPKFWFKMKLESQLSQSFFFIWNSCKVEILGPLGLEQLPHDVHAFHWQFLSMTRQRILSKRKLTSWQPRSLWR